MLVPYEQTWCGTIWFNPKRYGMATPEEAMQTQRDNLARKERMTVSCFRDEIPNKFTYHKPPNDQVVQAHTEIREACHSAALQIWEAAPPCEESIRAITKLEEAMFWGNAAVARHHEHYTEQEAEG